MTASDLHHSTAPYAPSVGELSSLSDAPKIPGVYAVTISGVTKFGRSNNLQDRMKAYALASHAAEDECRIFYIPTKAPLAFENVVLAEAKHRGLQNVSGAREAFKCGLEDAKDIMMHVMDSHKDTLRIVEHVITEERDTVKAALKPKGVIRKSGLRVRAEFCRQGVRKGKSFDTRQEAADWLESVYQDVMAKTAKKTLRSATNDMEAIDAALTAMVGEERATLFKKYIRGKKTI